MLYSCTHMATVGVKGLSEVGRMIRDLGPDTTNVNVGNIHRFSCVGNQDQRELQIKDD